MNIKNLIGIAGIIVVAGACVPSVNPFYTEKDIVFEPGLVGEWQKGGTNQLETWKFEKSGENAYNLVVTDKDDKQGKLDARLFKIDGQLFLDLIPNDCGFAPTQADVVNAAMFPGHLLLRVPQLQPKLQLAYCDYDWLSKCLQENPEALKHHREGDRGLLTAETKDLQGFIRQHLAELFQTPEEFKRRPAR